MARNDVILSIFDTILLGYAFTVLLFIILGVFKSKNLKTFTSKFINYSILTIRLVGLVYFIYYIISLSIYLSSDEVTAFSSRATGKYAWAYWIMLLRPFIFCGITQLFWIRKIQKSTIWIVMLTLIILVLVLLSGPNIERLIISITGFHRDFSNTDLEFRMSIVSLIATFFLSIIKNAIVFSSLVFTYWFIAEKLEKK